MQSGLCPLFLNNLLLQCNIHIQKGAQLIRVQLGEFALPELICVSPQIEKEVITSTQKCSHPGPPSLFLLLPASGPHIRHHHSQHLAFGTALETLDFPCGCQQCQARGLLC